MRLGVIALVVAAACGPVAYVHQVTMSADDAVEAARAAHAEKYSPYWWTRANEYLHMARVVAGHAGLVVGAWYGSSILIRKGYTGALMYAGGAVALFLMILIVGTIHRLGTAADYLGFTEQHGGVSLFSVRLGWAFVVSLLAMFGSAIYISIELGRDGRRVRAR